MVVRQLETIFKLKQEIVNWISCLSLKIVSVVQVAILELRKIKWDFILVVRQSWKQFFKLKQEIVNWISCLSLKIVSVVQVAILELRKIKWDFILVVRRLETIFKLKQEIVNWISCLSLKIVSADYAKFKLRYLNCKIK